jgi:hypothetical protein
MRCLATNVFSDHALPVAVTLQAMSGKWTMTALVGFICFVFGVLVASGGPDKYIGPQGAVDKPAANTSVFRAKDFAIDLRIKKQECFGSAGCNVTLGVQPKYVGPKKKRPDGEWEVTYSISGSDRGPMINTFTIEGTQMTFEDSERLSTASGSVIPSAEVTSVRQVRN